MSRFNRVAKKITSVSVGVTGVIIHCFYSDDKIRLRKQTCFILFVKCYDALRVKQSFADRKSSVLNRRAT